MLEVQDEGIKLVAKGRSEITHFLLANCAAVARWGLSSGVLCMLKSNRLLSLSP
jgi:hypothetical protein